MIKVYILSIILFFNLKSSRACDWDKVWNQANVFKTKTMTDENLQNGYTFKLNSVKNCIDNSVIRIPPKGLNVVLDNDCNIIISGCVDVTKPIKTAKGTYHLEKPPLPPFDGKLDFCDALNQYDMPILKQALTSVGMPTKCPAPAKKACGSADQKISIAEYKNQLGMAAGTTTVKLDVEHDSGKTCAEFSFTLSRAKKG